MIPNKPTPNQANSELKFKNWLPKFILENGLELIDDLYMGS